MVHGSVIIDPNQHFLFINVQASLFNHHSPMLIFIITLYMDKTIRCQLSKESHETSETHTSAIAKQQQIKVFCETRRCSVSPLVERIVSEKLQSKKIHCGESMFGEINPSDGTSRCLCALVESFLDLQEPFQTLQNDLSHHLW